MCIASFNLTVLLSPPQEVMRYFTGVRICIQFIELNKYSQAYYRATHVLVKLTSW